MLLSPITNGQQQPTVTRVAPLPRSFLSPAGDPLRRVSQLSVGDSPSLWSEHSRGSVGASQRPTSDYLQSASLMEYNRLRATQSPTMSRCAPIFSRVLDCVV